MTEEKIKLINSDPKIDSWNEGIFKEPQNVPITEKDYLIYQRWNSGGVAGGSCWDEGEGHNYEYSHPDPKFTILEIVLDELCPDITLKNYNEVLKLIKENETTNWEYYGNYDNYQIRYIRLKDLENLIKSWKN